MKLALHPHSRKDAVKLALGALTAARNYLAAADCPKTLARARQAISSAKGALRNAENRSTRAAR